ncbi:type I-C CRISPR-associated endonuclease Cas1 [Pelagicoccus sp. NFK12]|uniref:CRISPR-associated endonuclease Cas1 n=1 Tax=Pelagicoccus enzymogenes TaxID=2773457 RepID=A0A927F8S6_9BACT|nr:type I-C CRISPR-associated endonuclease Cas1c [Pelagicoccus enzymogenes]MBD5779013.1 type I-C CRISPR-associated endonuclease Cas1 [Pelagicoccus enzymogenes]
MRRHLNTLFVTLEGAYLKKDGAAIDIRHEGKSRLRVPLHNLDGIACFAWDCSASAALMAACAEANVSLSFHNPNGKFLAASNGFTTGNVLLRREQYRRADREEDCLAIASHLVAAKIANSRTNIQRALRDHGTKSIDRMDTLRMTSDALYPKIRSALVAEDVDSLRGIEGEAAACYFLGFSSMLTGCEGEFAMKGRSRRPARDPINALLSLAYTLLMHDCRSALESCGLDPQCGFLHKDRPGRPSLALDLMEEFRACLADRLVLTLINRKQIGRGDFQKEESGAVLLKEAARKKVYAAWQERKQTEILHPFLNEKTTVGLLPHLQARLLARLLRGDLDGYPAYLQK